MSENDDLKYLFLFIAKTHISLPLYYNLQTRDIGCYCCYSDTVTYVRNGFENAHMNYQCLKTHPWTGRVQSIIVTFFP